MPYIAPIGEILFTLKHIAQYQKITDLPGNEDFSWDVAEAILEESSKLASGVLAPLNQIGDTVGAKFVTGKVVLPNGWKDAFDELAQGGWVGLSGEPDFGGQGMPDTISVPVSEMWQSANLAFSLCNLLTQGAMRAIASNASEELKSRYLPNMNAGMWSGTMNLTEPHAGSDLAALSTKAVRVDDHYLISGQKVFISYGEHDMNNNIIHLVLARTPGAPPGVKGISLFIVPKFLVNEDGSLGERNDLTCVSLEHKMGIHASPTAVMSFGDNDGAVGYLVGEENLGLKHMFVMMNQTRFEIGLQGLGLAERAYQQAVNYARERVQGQPIGRDKGTAIIGHMDVKRMLVSMKCRIDAMRSFAYWGATFQDFAHKSDDEDERKSKAAFYEYLTPILKAWLTEECQDITSVGVQVHGGVGFIEETGAAQYYRDAKILTIYEGTTGIQAADLTFRKTLFDQGAMAQRALDEVQNVVLTLKNTGDWGTDMAAKLQNASRAAKEFIDWLVGVGSKRPDLAAASSDQYMRLMGTLLGGSLLLKSAALAQSENTAGNIDTDFANQKTASATYFANYFLPRVKIWAESAQDSSQTLTSFEDSWF